MTTDIERLRRHFGITVEDIPLQKQVIQDIHDILIKLGACKVQTPNCVAISTENGWHKIINYPFNTTPNHWGQYEHSICLEIPVKYEFDKLEEFIKQQVQSLFKE
jgi:uncharacterized protein (DUF1499 family)